LEATSCGTRILGNPKIKSNCQEKLEILKQINPKYWNIPETYLLQIQENPERK
jgi:hypothetical protein